MGTTFVRDCRSHAIGRNSVLIDKRLDQDATHFSGAEYSDATL
jgi:hypothetical protein